MLLNLYGLVALALVALGLGSFDASAGPNLDGRLILHSNASLMYTTENSGYCGQSALPACSLAVTTLPADGGTHVVHVVAAFSDSALARLSGVSFGIDYDPELIGIIEYGSCGDFELADPSWPDPSTGTAITWGDRPSGRLIEVYWLAAYIAEGQSTLLELTPHPTQGGYFADGAEPANLDEIADFGALGFDAAGSLPCPPPDFIEGGSWGSIIGQ